jgi:hypothetical protein
MGHTRLGELLRRLRTTIAWLFLAACAVGVVASLHWRFDLDHSGPNGWTSLSLRGGGVSVTRANPSWASDVSGWHYSTSSGPTDLGGMLPWQQSSYEFRELNVPLWVPMLLVAVVLAWRRRRKQKANGFEVITQLL